MNIFFRELKANLKSLIIWCVITVLFIAVGFSKFSAYYNNPEMLAILKDFPPAMLSALSLNAFNLTTVTGFLGVMYTYFALLLSVAAVMWGSDIISKEERDKTVEFSLTLPVTRGKVITAKTLAAFVNCVALLVITAVVTVASAQQYKPDQNFYNYLALIVAAIFIIQIIFLAVGILLGCAMKQYRRASSLAVSILLVTYFFSIISGLSKNLEFLKFFSPFKYFDPALLLSESKIQVTYVGLSIAIVVLSMVAGYLLYSKRDLYI
jgi:beta-exotoxin I transport system permease protein